jgi:hypothetical protein
MSTWLSKPAVLWAMDETDGVPARLRFTLVAVARYAGTDGRGAYPSLAQIAWITGKSVPQVSRDVASLVKLGVLLPGDPGLVKDIRADRRPKVYDLAMPRVASGRNPWGGSRVASGAGTGCMARRHGLHLDANKEVLKGTSRTAREGASAEAHPPAPRAPAQTHTPRRAPPCPDCGVSYTQEQLADDEFCREAMAGTAGCVHPRQEVP